MRSYRVSLMLVITVPPLAFAGRHACVKATATRRTLIYKARHGRC
jgi:hypothetical protein